jgi:hypothetical protein
LVSLQPKTDFEAAHARHHNVEEDKVRPLFARDLEGLFTVGCCQDRVLVGGEAGPCDFQTCGIVIDN